jgi:hypothetical protein
MAFSDFTVNKGFLVVCCIFLKVKLSYNMLRQRILPLHNTGTIKSFCQTLSGNLSKHYNTVMEREQIIEAQKKRAIDYWNNSNMNDALKMSVYDEVLEKLQQGLVPPIYHALCRTPEKRLFDPLTKLSNEMNDSAYIQLSTDPVTAGTLAANKGGLEKDTKDKIKRDDEISYMDSFFTPNGIPRLEVEDGASQNKWTFDADFTSHVAALVNEPAKMVGEDVEVTHLQSTFYVDNLHGTNLITRRLSRGVVGDCFERSEAHSIYAIVGSPGIGKSWTLIYALQQALLYVNVCVLFYFSKYHEAIACIRKGNEVFVWIADGIEDCHSRFFDNSNVIVLLDPVEETKGGTRFTYRRQRLIFAASNNDQHLGNIYKHTGGFKRILSTYTEKELKVALRYMIQNKDVENNQEVMRDALQRANIVGNVPCYLVSVAKYDDRKNKTDFALMKVQQMEFQKLLGWNGIVDDRYDQKAYESIFLLFADSKYDIDETSLDDDDDDDDEDRHVDDDDKNSHIGYDGESGINYGKSHIAIMSNYVFEKVVGKNRDRILSYWCQVRINEPSILRSTLVDMFWQDLQNKKQHFRTFEMKPGNDENVCNDLDVTYHSVVLDNVDVKDLRTKCFSSNDTLCRMKAGTTLIDFAGPSKNVYHMAVGTTYPNLCLDVKELFLASGHLEAVESVPTRDDITNDSPDCKKVATQVDKFNFYWVIPYGLETTWKSRAARTMNIINDDDSTTRLVKECFNTCVKQFFLVMDQVPLENDKDEAWRKRKLS